MIPTGRRALEAIVERLGALAREGRPTAILWDMDGTLVDTRPRMLAAVHAYGRTDVRLSEVSPSWQETARRLELDPVRFVAVWHRVFWAYESFDADVENADVVALARLAEAEGVQTIIVTGRVEELRPVTARQLERLGLNPSRVFLKSHLGDQTPSVKAQVISQLAAEGLHMGAFVTDSPEELAAITPEILGAAPDLALIFVELEGTAPELSSLIHRFPVPFRNGPGMEEATRQLRLGEGAMEFGFEAEFEIESADRLLRLYDPEGEAGVSASEWHSWTARRRAHWVYDRFPKPHSEEFDLPLRRNQQATELDFLPEGLFVDSDGNIEVASRPLDDLTELWNQVERLDRHCGPSLVQVTVSVPSGWLLMAEGGLASLDGFLAFYHFLDIFERMGRGHAHYQENPDREVLLPFLHSWLGPMTAGKHRFMRQYLEANAVGERLDEKWARLVDRAFSSFKYITGSAYRPALAGPERIAIEIRDAHRNRALLAQRVTRLAASLLSGLGAYAPFSQTWAFDSERDYERLPGDVRLLLEKVIPTRVRPEIDEMYSSYDRVALQVYRNFALPLKDYSDVEMALGDQPGDDARLGKAQRTYLERLGRLAEAKDEGVEVLRRRLQGALAAFAVESGLWFRLEAFSQSCLSTSAARAAAQRVHDLLPMTRAQPRTGWSGPLAHRLSRLRARWPEHVHLSSQAFSSRDSGPFPEPRGVERPLLLLSVKGLEAQEMARLRGDFLDAVARHTLGLRVTDRGDLELRYGQEVLSPGEEARDERAYEPFSNGAGRELTLALSELEGFAVSRHLAAHQPCDQAARRVSASGWFRHLRMSERGEKMETSLGLPHPESIETARQLWERVLFSGDCDRVVCLVEWTEQSLEERIAELAGVTPSSERSILQSGFPATLKRDRPLQDRLKAFVQRWPGHSRLVWDVPFVFGKGSQLRTVFVLATHGLSDGRWRDFRQDYADTVGADTISFPCRLRAEHLRTRIGTLALALSAEGVRVDDYEPPRQRRRLEPVVELEPDEIDRLRRYVGAVLDDTLGRLGPITLGPGCRKATGSLTCNRPTDAGEHNCTTWITLAPIGRDGQDLATLVQMPDTWSSHDNPGWWTMFLTGASRSARARTVIYWTDGPLEDETCASGHPIPWDFNPH